MDSAPESTTYTFLIDETAHGRRVDKALSLYLTDMSRAYIQTLIAEGHVLINDQPCLQAKTKLSAGDTVVLRVPPPAAWHPEPQNIPLDIVYEDDDLLVLNKQAGLVVHPGAGNRDGTLVNALLHHCGDRLSGIGGVLRPGIVHRLDKDTTGLMVVAKSDRAHQGLSGQFTDRSLSRRYTALVLGVPMPPKGTIDKPIGRHRTHRQKMSVIARGKPARTHYQVLSRYKEAFSLIECRLESGRTHQIRVHMQAIKHALIGDPAYGPQQTAVGSALKKAEYDQDTAGHVLRLERQMLHAHALSFLHPVQNEHMSFEADLPPDMAHVLEMLSA